MTDTISEKRRSWNMSRIKAKDTKPELIVRSFLHKMGYRFRLHGKYLPGKPDIILPKYKTVVFVHGCFWHRHMNCKYAYNPKSNVDLWNQKFTENIARDQENTNKLKNSGWKVIVVWECEIPDMELLRKRLSEGIRHSESQ